MSSLADRLRRAHAYSHHTGDRGGSVEGPPPPARCVHDISVNYKCPALTNDNNNWSVKANDVYLFGNTNKHFLYVPPPSECAAPKGNARTAHAMTHSVQLIKKH